MQIWYDESTGRVAAVYSDTYSGQVWVDMGLVPVEMEGDLPPVLVPGAIVDVVDGAIIGIVPSVEGVEQDPDPDISRYSAALTVEAKIEILAERGGLLPNGSR